MNAEQILQEFKDRQQVYEILRMHGESLLGELLANKAAVIHSITSRLKEVESLRAKLIQPDKTYCALSEVTDVVGFRIVTYFEDSVNEVAEAIERYFVVDYARSIDKRQPVHSSAFGYRSLHYVAQLPDHLVPEPGLANIPFEIQVRTILQHAWAEIEHDLGYKSKESIPQSFRRRFSRLAGLLEIADDEFVAIKNQLAQYEHQVQVGWKKAAADITINRLSLTSFINSSLVRRLDADIAQRLGLKLDDEVFFPEYLCRMLEKVGLQSIHEVGEQLKKHQHELMQFVQPYFEFTERTWRFGVGDLDRFYRGYALFFLAHRLAYEGSTLDLGRIEAMAKFYEALDFPGNRDEAWRVARQFVEAMRSLPQV